MAELPIFVEKPNVGFATLQIGANVYQANQLSRSNNPDAILKVFTAGPSGSLIYNAKIAPLGTNVATVIRISVVDPSNSNEAPCIYEQAFAATTASQTAALAASEVQFNMKLQAGFEL